MKPEKKRDADAADDKGQSISQKQKPHREVGQ
jgi:hypothetical protein